MASNKNNKQMVKIKNEFAPNSVFSGYYCVSIDENYVEEYTGKVLDSQNHQLDPLKHDLANWINRTLGIHYLTGDNFLNELDNGAVLCHLAQVIKARAKIYIGAGLTRRPLPKIRDKYFENAMKRSFFSRDNMENFIKFCKSIGVHQNLLFESDDLVLHNQPRNVILCLLEVARIATQYGIEPPNLIQLEKEMFEEERHPPCNTEVGSEISWQFRSLPSRFECENLRYSRSVSPLSLTHYKWNSNQIVPFRNKSVNTEDTGPLSLPQLISTCSTEISVDDVDQQSSTSSKDDSYVNFDTKLVNESNQELDELDKKVEQAAQVLHSNCRCANRRYMKLKIKKIGEGKYTIAGRNVLVRLLKSRHMMVRVGGGWDTLDHFLQRHDPCQADGKEYKPFLSRTSTVSILPNYSKRYTYYSTFKKILRPGESAI